MSYSTMNKQLLIEEFLAKELNLSTKEISLYINLVKYDSLSILELAEISGINRATTHVNIDNLAQKGLVTQIKKGKGSRRLIVAEPPEKLSIIFQERKTRMEAAENQLNLVINEISGLKKEHRQSDKAEIRRYEGKDEVKLIYEDVLKSKEIRAYVNCSKLSKIFPSNIPKFLATHKKRHDMHMWEIIEKSTEAKKYAEQIPSERYQVRFASKYLNLAAIDYLLFDGNIAIIEVSPTTGVSGLVIKNENFYKNANAIYKFVWAHLPDHKL